MVKVHSCWTPCFMYTNVRDGTKAVAIYTFLSSVFVIIYNIYVMSGGDSSQLWLPFFETSLDQDTIPAAGFTTFYFVLLALFSLLLSFGVSREIRGFFLPWFIAMGLVILFQAIFGLWLIFGYYIYLEVIFVALCCWLWMAVNMYAFLVVRSHYNNLKQYQSPDIEFVA